MTFIEYLRDRYRIDDIDKITNICCKVIDIDEIINTGVCLSTEDAISYYQSNYNILNYYYLLLPPDKDDTIIWQKKHATFIFPQCDYFYYAKKYYHLLISCLYNGSVDFILTYDLFNYSCLHLNDNERDIILNILNRRNMIEHIAILLNTRPMEGDRKNFDL